jgi:hypothetical protein
MKFIAITLAVLLPFLAFSQEEKKVLVEVFTNSHCTLCPEAHNFLDNYANTNGNAEKLSLIYYHMVYPYPDDLLYHHNPLDSDGRHDYYQPVAATPRGFFDGEIQGSISTWNSKLNDLINTDSPLKIMLQGFKSEGRINIKAIINRSGDVPDNDLVLHFVVAENVYYAGRNGILNHKDVMRKMVTSAAGEPFSINLNETKEVEKEIIPDPVWIPDSLKVIVFVQSSGSKNVYQSETIAYSELMFSMNVKNDNEIPSQLTLEQNYPNPFNPSTKIKYHLAEENFVGLKIYNIIGEEISALVNEKQAAGSYEYTFNAGNLPSGIYLYKLTVIEAHREKTTLTKKMILIR